MIDPKELRLGNWVDLYDEETGSSYHRVNITLLSSSEFINPIALTPEILEACGAEQDNIAYFISDSNGRMVFLWNKESQCLSLSEGIGWGYDLPHVKYLHQFQNAYYFATGTELTVNLTSLIQSA